MQIPPQKNLLLLLSPHMACYLWRGFPGIPRGAGDRVRRSVYMQLAGGCLARPVPGPLRPSHQPVVWQLYLCHRELYLCLYLYLICVHAD